jgi:hypothetical protein
VVGFSATVGSESTVGIVGWSGELCSGVCKCSGLGFTNLLGGWFGEFRADEVKASPEVCDTK